MTGYDHINVDETILNWLTRLNLDPSSARKYIESNKHNHLTTAYYLLLKKHIQNGGRSIADISTGSISIDPRAYSPKPISS